MPPTKEQVVSVLRATLLSCKGAVTLHQCNRDYRELEGEPIPYGQLGYKSLEEFISDIPDIKLKRDYNGQITVDAVPTESTQHIADMIARQKSAPRKPAPRGYLPRMIKPDSWRKTAPPNNNYKSQFYKQQYYKPTPKSYNNNFSNSYSNTYSKPTQNYKTPEPHRKNGTSDHRSVTINNEKTSPPKPVSAPSKPAYALSKPASTPPKPASAPSQNTNVKPTPSAVVKTPSNVARTVSIEKKLSLSARMDAACLAEESDKPSAPSSAKISKALSRMSNLRESLNSVDVVPLPLPANQAPAQQRIQHMLEPAAPPPPLPQLPPLPADATAQDKLLWLCKRYGLPEPIYKTNTMKEKKGPTSFLCVVKIGSEYSATTYPESTPSEFCARELAASQLVPEVERRGVEEARRPTPPAEPSMVLARLGLLVAAHQSGVWASTLPDQYREKYNENLPSNWQDLVESSLQFNTDRGVNGQLMILPKTVELNRPLRITPPRGPAEPQEPVVDLPVLQLPDEPFWNVFVTTVSSTVEVWLRLIGEQYSDAYHQLLDEMESYYANSGVVVTNVVLNSWYAVQLDEGWLRALAIEMLADGRVLVFLGDHGDDEAVHVSQLRLLSPRFTVLPTQGILCRLDKMEELASSEEQVELVQPYVRAHLVNKVLVAVPSQTAVSDDRSVAVTIYRTDEDEEGTNVNNEILKDVCTRGELSLDQKLCDVEVGCVSAEGHVWVVHAAGARLVRDALALLTAPTGPYHRPLPAASPTQTPNSNQLYVVRTLEKCGGAWFRCSVRSGVAADGTVSARLVDSGQTMRAPLEKLVPLASYSPALAEFPPQAKAVRLGSAQRVAHAMVERLRQLVLNTSVLCRAASTSTQRCGAEPDVELFVRPHGVLASVNQTILYEFEHLKTPVKPKEAPKDSPLEVLSRKKERIFSRTGSSGACHVPIAVGHSSSQLPALALPQKGECVNVNVTMAANPCNFVIQLTRPQERAQLSGMMNQLQEECPSLSPTPSEAPAPGELYTLLYKDKFWYRVVVANVVSQDMVSVYFCDFGDLALVSAAELRRVPHTVPLARSLPPQAIKAKLYGVAPLHQDWSVEDCIRFQELTVNQEFAALVRDIGSDPLNGDPLLTVDLVNTETSDDVYLNQKLEAEGRAKVTK